MPENKQLLGVAKQASEVFVREIMGVWPEPSEEQRALETLAAEYNRRVEEFDAAATAGLGPPGRSAVHPGLVYQRCNQNAMRVRQEIAAQGEQQGFSRPQVFRAIADYRQKLRYDKRENRQRATTS
jgi:hypothetical protein